MKKLSNTDPVDTGRPGRLLNVLCTFNLRPVPTGEADFKKAFLIKKVCTSSFFPFLITMRLSKKRLSVSYHYAFLRDKYVSRSFAIFLKKFHTKRFYCMIAALWNRKHFR